MAVVEELIGSDGWSWITRLVTLASLYPVTIWIYNLFFHRLAEFPGPLFWRASRLPYMRATWSGHFPHIVSDLHRQYGDIVRVAPNELSIRSPSAWDDIYSNSNSNKAFSKSEIWHGNPDGGPASIFVTPDLRKHARVRRFMDPAFSERAVLGQEPILHKYVDMCVQKLREQCSAKDGKTTVNIIHWLDFTLLDIIGDLAFGESFDCLRKCEYEEWMDDMSGVIKLHFLSINLRYYPIINTILKPIGGLLIPRKIVKQFADYSRRAATKLERRLKSNVDRPDIVSQLLRSEDQSEGLDPEEVRVNAMLFINAASETTATTLTGAFNYLIQNPTSLSKLEQELRQFPSSSDLTLQALRDLPYLNAVLREALRMCGPTPIGNFRITPPEGGMISGHYVPGNTMVNIPPVAMSFNEAYFHEPHAWRPERWLQEASTNPQSPYYNDNRNAVHPFGLGPYNCIGIPLAWAQMRLIVAKILWSFQVTKANTPNASIAWEKQKVYGIIFKSPLDVTIAERVA